MKGLLLTLLLIVGGLIIVAVMMQPSRQQDALSALSGGGGDLFAERKSRGFEATMRHITAILTAVWFAIGLALMWLQAN